MFSNSNPDPNEIKCSTVLKQVGYIMMGITATMGVITCTTRQGPQCIGSSFQDGPDCNFIKLELLAEAGAFGLSALASFGSLIPSSLSKLASVSGLTSWASKFSCRKKLPDNKDENDDDVDYEPNKKMNGDNKEPLLVKINGGVN